jgi:type IV pilus assembly protein PilY1
LTKDGDFITDYVYAGDLFGQVWRFGLTDKNLSKWKISDFGTGSPTPLFRAADASGKLHS